MHVVDHPDVQIGDSEEDEVMVVDQPASVPRQHEDAKSDYECEHLGEVVARTGVRW